MLEPSTPRLPKQEGGNGNGGCCNNSNLPPIFPPTPTSANSDTQDFVHYFENRIAPEYSDSLYHLSSLQSPAYASMTMDSAYSSYFKHEAMYPLPSCMHPTSLPLDGLNNSPAHYDATPPPPLTPQSSFCSSSNSPLSHISIHSPESAAMTPDLESARPISQGSMYSLQGGSPHIVGDMAAAHTPLPAYSSSGSSCSSPLQHSSSLDIAASLDLVARGGASSYVMQHGYNGLHMTAPPLYPGNTTMALGMEAPYRGMTAAYPPVTPPTLAEGVYSAHDMMSGYSQYEEFDLLMSDPSELLTKCVGGAGAGGGEEKDPAVTTGSQLSSFQAHTPPAVALIQ